MLLTVPGFAVGAKVEVVEDAAPLDPVDELAGLVVGTIPALVVLVHLRYLVLDGADVRIDVEQLDVKCLVLSPLHHPHC